MADRNLPSTRRPVDYGNPKQRRWAQEIARQESAALRAWAHFGLTPPPCPPADLTDDFHPNRRIETVRLCADTPARLIEPRGRSRTETD